MHAILFTDGKTTASASSTGPFLSDTRLGRWVTVLAGADADTILKVRMGDRGGGGGGGVCRRSPF